MSNRPPLVHGRTGPIGAHLRFTGRHDGDLASASPGVDRRRRAVVDLPWTWLHQVHGADVVTVDAPGALAGTSADAAVTGVPGAVVSVLTADCAPVALLADDAVGAVHAGWRGLAAGIVPAAVDALRRLTDRPIRAVVGPCIEPECYEFGSDDLDAVAAVLGHGVRATTRSGAPALDLPEAVAAALRAAGVEEIDGRGVCTACSPDHWSHRAAGDPERQALAVWLGPPASA